MITKTKIPCTHEGRLYYERSNTAAELLLLEQMQRILYIALIQLLHVQNLTACSQFI